MRMRTNETHAPSNNPIYTNWLLLVTVGCVVTEYVQMKRVKGFKLPENTHLCTRPHSAFANPFTLSEGVKLNQPLYELGMAQAAMDIWLARRFNAQPRDAQDVVEMYGKFLNRVSVKHPDFLKALNQYNFLSCWCPVGQPCHVQDVLLPLVNT